MTSDGPAIIIERQCKDWPGGARTLTPCNPPLPREPNRPQVYWFGAEFDQEDGTEVHYRISREMIQRMKEQTPRARGDRLVDALIDEVTPDRPLEPGINRFKVYVSDAGDTRLERLR